MSNVRSNHGVKIRNSRVVDNGGFVSHLLKCEILSKGFRIIKHNGCFVMNMELSIPAKLHNVYYIELCSSLCFVHRGK